MDKTLVDSKRLVYLAIKLFKDNPEGQEFLALLKSLHLNTPTFPLPSGMEKKMERHGGALGWAAFREGNLDMLRKIELMANSKDYLKEKDGKDE